jgi:hypothetical protein
MNHGGMRALQLLGGSPALCTACRSSGPVLM